MTENKQTSDYGKGEDKQGLFAMKDLRIFAKW